MFKSTTPPLCLYCGGNIRKATVINWVEKARSPYMTDTPWSRHVVAETPLMTIQDCRKITNEQVMSVRKSNADGSIRTFSTWDGESYVDQFFCNGEHARAFAYRTARKLYE